MERREWHELCNRGHLPVFRNIRAPRGRGGAVGGSVVSRVKAEGKSFPPRPRAAPGQADSRVCTPCTGGQIAGAAGSQAGLSRTGGADPGRPGGTHRSGGTNARVCDEREPAPPLPSHAPDCPDTPVAQLITLLHSVGSPAVTPGGSFHLTMALGYGGTSVPRGPQTCPHARPTAPPFTPSLSGTAARCTDRRCSSSDVLQVQAAQLLLVLPTRSPLSLRCGCGAGTTLPRPASLFFLTATGRRPPRRHRHLPASLVPQQNCSGLPNESHITDANQGLMPPCKSLWNLGWTLAAAVICCVLFPRTSQLAPLPS